MRSLPIATWLALALLAAPAAAQVPDSTQTPAPEVTPVPETTPGNPTPVTNTMPPAPPPVVSTLALPALVPARTPADVARDQGAAAALTATSETEMQTLRVQATAAHSRVAVKQQEIRVVETKLKAARKNKEQANADALDRDRKRLEAEQRLLERLEDVDQADLARATAARDYGRAWGASATLEGEFLGRAAERTGTPARGIRDLELKLLTAQRNAAEKLESLAKRQQDLAAKRVRVHDAWGALQAL